MADFDAVEFTLEQIQIQQLQNQVKRLIGQLQRVQQNQVPQYVPPLPTRPNPNLPQPPYYSGNPLELSTFKIKLIQYIRGNFNTYFDDLYQLMCAGAVLTGPAQQWYETLLDPLQAQ